MTDWRPTCPGCGNATEGGDNATAYLALPALFLAKRGAYFNLYGVLGH